MYSLSQSVGYGVLALAHMDPEGAALMMAADIANAANIPKPYLSKVLAKLQSADIIEGKRGQNGGLRLKRPANEISILDLVIAIDGEDWRDRCLLGLPNCGGDCPCPAHSFWLETKPKIEECLRTTTLDKVRDFTDAGWKMSLAAAQ